MTTFSFDHAGTPAQIDFWKSDAKYRAFVGGIGSGKTRAGCLEILRQPAGSVVMAVAPTYQMLRDACLATFLAMAGPAVVGHHKSQMVTDLANGTRILWRSADSPERLRGVNLSAFWIDEAAMVSTDAFNVLVGRLRRLPGRAWITTTPRGKNWIYDNWITNATDDHHLTKAVTASNRWLPPDFVARLRRQYTSIHAMQELGGEFIDPEGSLFDRAWFKVIDNPPGGLRWVRYWDLAFSLRHHADYMASIAMSLGSDGQLYIRDGVHGQWSWPQARKVIMTTAQTEPDTAIGIEVVGAQLGPYQDLCSLPEMASKTIRPMLPKGDKVTRAQPLAARAEQGMVSLVRGAWVKAFLDEVCAFPGTPHDDWVDTASGGLQMIGLAQSDVTVPSARPMINRVVGW